MNRGEIYYADLSPVIGSEQGGYRPVVILQNNKGNKYSTTVIVAPISSRLTKNALPTHVFIEPHFLEKKSVILLLADQLESKREALRNINKTLESNIFFLYNSMNIRHNNCDPASL